MMFLRRSRGRLVLFAIAVLSLQNTHAQSDNSVLNNIRRAHEILSDAYAEMNYNNSVGDLRMEMSGIYYYAGHFEKPGVTREYSVSGNIVFSEYGTQLLRNDTFKRLGSTIISSYEIDGENISVIEGGDTLDVSKYDVEKYLYKAAMLNPNLFLQLTVRNAAQSSFVNSNKTHHIIRHTNTSGSIYYLFVNKETFFLDRIEEPEYDKMTGDYFISTTFDEYNVKDGYQTPHVIIKQRDSNVIFKLKVNVKNILPGMNVSDHNISKQQIGDWMYVLSLPEWDSKVGIADMKDFLIVFEAPHSPTAGYAILEYIRKNFRNKKVKYCVISHHHPDHMGGIRPFLENGTTIVTTKGNEQLINTIAINTHLYSDEVRNKKPVSPDYLFITDYRYDIKSDGRQVTIYPYGRKSSQTDEYLISYVPSEHLLIEGDLLKAWDIRQRRLTEQESNLFEYIDEQKMDVERILQTWPLKNTSTLIEYEKIAPDVDGKLKKTSKRLLESIKGK